MSWTHVRAVLASALNLIFVLLGLGFGTAVFWHAALGMPLLAGPAGQRKVEIPSPTTTAQRLPNEEVAVFPGTSELEKKIAPAASETLPPAVIIDVPFSPQAPFGNWSQPFKDACEETSVLMAIYWAGKMPLDAETANREILETVAFEEYNFGYHRDTALKETLNIFLYRYRYPNVKLFYDITVEDVKHELAAGNLVIVPAAGELLANPYFKTPPPYHMLVVRGYDDRRGEFITNDPGTIQGEGFRYSYENLYGAIHDWPGPERNVREGRKGMIAVYPPDQPSAL